MFLCLHPCPSNFILNYTLQQFCIPYVIVSVLFVGNIHYINEKSRHYNVFTICVHGGKDDEFLHPCTDTGGWMWTYKCRLPFHSI